MAIHRISVDNTMLAAEAHKKKSNFFQCVQCMQLSRIGPVQSNSPFPKPDISINFTVRGQNMQNKYANIPFFDNKKRITIII